MFAAIREQLSSMSLAVRVLVGAFFGILCGVMFGDYCAILSPVGSAYVMMLQAVVYPYIICLVLLGIGGLSRQKCFWLFKRSWPFYGAAFGLTLGVIWLLHLGLPTTPPPSAVNPTQPVSNSTDLLHILIPSNVFESLTRDYLPGVIVFAILFAISIQQLKGKSDFLQVVQIVRDGCAAMIKWVLSLSPFGVFAILAKTSGTTSTSALTGLIVYLILFFAGVILIVFWLLPALMAALTPFRYREIMKEMKRSLVLSGSTSISVVALPLVKQSAQNFAEKAGIRDEDCNEVVETSLSVAYVLAHIGNLVVYFFVLFALERFHVQPSGGQLLLLPALTAISSIGAASSTFNALDFLQSWLGLPEGTSQLYLETFAITRFGQTLLSVIGFGSITFLSTLAYFGKVRLHPRKFLICVLGFVGFGLLLLVLVWGLREYVHTEPVDLRPTFSLPNEVTHGIDVKIFRNRGEWENTHTQDEIRPGESTLERIQRTKTLRVGYNAQVFPFSYFNTKRDLVGYDIAYAYNLAESLNVRLKLIPFDWGTVTAELEQHRLDIAMSAIYLTDVRLKTLMSSQPYFQSPAAFIVPSRQTDRFLNVTTMRNMGPLTFAVLNSRVAHFFVQRAFPDAKLVVLPSYDELPLHPEMDAALWTLVQGAAWARFHPGYTAVVPRNLGSVMVFGYMMPPGSEELVRFVNYWLDLRKADGFEKAQRDYWILGNPRTNGDRRWCIIRNLFHWVD